MNISPGLTIISKNAWYKAIITRLVTLPLAYSGLLSKGTRPVLLFWLNTA
jgi:hypothetical protein